MSGKHILIAGGGPAGAFAASELCRLGHEVSLVTLPPARPALNGLAPRAWQALEQHGFQYARRASGPEVPRSAHWNGTVSALNSERLVERERFDAALLEDCRAKGARVIESRVRKLAASDGGANLVHEHGTLGGDFVIEARGRRAPAARRGATSGKERGPATVALASRYGRFGAKPMTAAGGFSEGWWWLAAPGDGTAIVQFFVDGERKDLAGRNALDRVYSHCADQADALERLLPAGARREGEVWALDATPLLAPEPKDARMVRAGDAAHRFDPLSGHGIFQAMGSGLAAAAVANTILEMPQAAPLAREFYRARTRESFLHFARVGRDFYRAERRWTGEPFWRARGAWPDDIPADVPEDGSAVARAEIVERPVVEDGLIQMRDVIVTPEAPRGVRLVAGVDVIDLMIALQRKGAVPPDNARLAKAFGATPEAMGLALAWLEQAGMLGG